MLPRMLSARLPLLLCSLTLAAGGCAYGELRQVLRAEVAAELDCPAVTVEPRNSEALRGSRDGDDQWKVRGCEVVRTYTCKAAGDEMVSYDDSGCSYVDGDVDAPKLATDESENLLDEDGGGDFQSDPEPLDEGADIYDEGVDVYDE